MSDDRLDLDAIEALCAAATDGPWHNFFHDDGYWVETGIRNKNGIKILSYCFRSAKGSDAHVYIALSDADERLVVQSRRLLPALIAELREHRAAIKKLGAVYACPSGPTDAVDQLLLYVKERDARVEALEGALGKETIWMAERIIELEGQVAGLEMVIKDGLRIIRKEIMEALR